MEKHNGSAMTEATRPGASDPVTLGRIGVPPEILPFGDGLEEAPEAFLSPLHLTVAEVEVMLCFALTSPLHYGPIEECLCEKLQRHLRRLYVWATAGAEG